MTLVLCRVSGKQGEALPAAGMLMEAVRARWHEGSHKGIPKLTALTPFLEEAQMFLASYHLLVGFKSYTDASRKPYERIN